MKTKSLAAMIIPLIPNQFETARLHRELVKGAHVQCTKIKKALELRARKKALVLIE